MATPDSNHNGLRGSKSGFRLPPIANGRQSIENLEIRESTKRNRIVTEEIQHLHQIAIFYGEKLEKEEEAHVKSPATPEVVPRAVPEAVRGEDPEPGEAGDRGARGQRRRPPRPDSRIRQRLDPGTEQGVRAESGGRGAPADPGKTDQKI